MKSTYRKVASINARYKLKNRVLGCLLSPLLIHHVLIFPLFFWNTKMILHFPPFLGKYELFLLLFSEFMYPLKMYFKDIKSVASNQDMFLINKSRF